MAKKRKRVSRKGKGVSLGVFLGTVVVVILALMYIVSSARESSVSDVRTFSDGLAVPDATSKITLSDKSASMVLQTSILPPDYVVTTWWFVFNQPDKCTHGQFGYRCGIYDLAIYGGDPAVQSSLIYASTDIPSTDGKQRFGDRITVGDTSKAVFGPGLVNPQGADIHLVVRVHGPAVKGSLDRKLKSYGEGCVDAPAGTGTPGDILCENFQFSVHQQA